MKINETDLKKDEQCSYQDTQSLEVDITDAERLDISQEIART